MIWDQSEPFPPDPNAPPSPSDRTPDALERAPAEVRTIGKAAGDELRRMVHGQAA
jgi:hypothetical protein